MENHYFFALTGGLVAINMGNERENTFFIIEAYFTKIVCDFNILSTMPVYSLAKANSQKSKRAEIIMLVMILTLIYPVVHIILTISLLEGKWYLLSTIVSYLCTIPPIISIMIYINHANLDYESTENDQKKNKKFAST